MPRNTKRQSHIKEMGANKHALTMNLQANLMELDEMADPSVVPPVVPPPVAPPPVAPLPVAPPPVVPPPIAPPP
ncbi:hypothetical protein BC938DRAFT_482846, partial [Jimgerdemannia flammicorona]